MPTRPRRYLIDVPGGEEEFGWEFKFDINAILNVMNRVITTGRVFPYVDLVNHLIRNDPDYGGGMGYLKYMEHPLVLIWMAPPMDLWEQTTRKAFADAPELFGYGEGMTFAQEWTEIYFNSGMYGRGDLGRIGYLVSANELSEAMLSVNFATSYIQARGGVIAIVNYDLQRAKYTIVPCDKRFFPIWGEELDIEPHSIGKLANSREWFWNVKPPTPYEKSVINNMFKSMRAVDAAVFADLAKKGGHNATPLSD